MSSVYLAVDPVLGREVALKVIHSNYTNQPGFIKRFEREAIALASLIHPHIVQIYDMGKEADTFFMVIQYLSGGTLKEQLQSYRQAKTIMPHKKVLEIFGPICDAVNYFHSSGFIHRDIKPSNIMFDDKGSPFITDFGIVKNVDWESHTSVGSILGTPLYMSPEQISGTVDHRTDIYSLGVILCEAMTGKLAYNAAGRADLFNIYYDQDFSAFEMNNPALPPGASRVILKAMAKELTDRFQTAAEFYSAIISVIEPPPTVNEPDTLRVDKLGFDAIYRMPNAYLKSVYNGVRYILKPGIDNRVGRSRPDNPIEVDLSLEKNSEFIHSTHVIVHHTGSGWELETLPNIQNPVFVNERKILPGEKVVLFNGDVVILSKNKMIFEIG